MTMTPEEQAVIEEVRAWRRGPGRGVSALDPSWRGRLTNAIEMLDRAPVRPDPRGAVIEAARALRHARPPAAPELLALAESVDALDAAHNRHYGVPCTCRAATEGGGHSHGCQYRAPGDGADPYREPPEQLLLRGEDAANAGQGGGTEVPSTSWLAADGGRSWLDGAETPLVDGETGPMADDDCLRLTPTAVCPAEGSPRCRGCVWRPA